MVHACGRAWWAVGGFGARVEIPANGSAGVGLRQAAGRDVESSVDGLEWFECLG